MIQATTLLILMSVLNVAPFRQDAKTLPPSVDLRPDFTKYGLLPRNQGRRDTCSLFAITALVEYELAKRHPDNASQLSQEYLVWAANQATGDKNEQAMFYDATQGLQMLGICTEALMPYKNNWDTQRKPSDEAIAEAKTRHQWNVQWIKRWNVKTGLSESQFQATKQQLAAKHPVAVGLRWPKEQKLNAEHVLTMPPTGGVFDGHSILFVGYRDDAKEPGGGVFLFRNSNGPKWAMQGYAWMPYAYVREYANDAVALHVMEPEVARQKTLLVEGEAMRIVESKQCRAFPQEMVRWGARLWSGNTQLYCRAQQGSVLELEWDIPHERDYHIDLLATCAPDYGQLQVSLGGKSVGEMIDLYGGRVYPSGTFDLGTHHLKAGKHRLKFTVVGKNEHSAGHGFGIDAIQLRLVK